MIIRQEQTAYLGKLAFIRRMRELICEQFPETCENPRHELNAEIYQQLERAERYGLLSEHAAGTYVMTAWMLGRRFDEQFPAVKETLEDPERAEAEKVLWLQTFTIHFLDALEKGDGG